MIYLIIIKKYYKMIKDTILTENRIVIELELNNNFILPRDINKLTVYELYEKILIPLSSILPFKERIDNFLNEKKKFILNNPELTFEASESIIILDKTRTMNLIEDGFNKIFGSIPYKRIRNINHLIKIQIKVIINIDLIEHEDYMKLFTMILIYSKILREIFEPYI